MFSGILAMTSRFSRLAVLGIVGALISGLFAAAPAGAGTVYMSVKSSNVAISSGGSGKVYVKCYASTTCRGTIWFEGEVAKKKSYAVAARSSGYVAVALTPGGPNDPATNGINMGDYKSNSGVKLWVQESSPKSFKHGYTVTLETPVTGRKVTGQVNGIAPLATNVKVQLITILKGGNTSYRESDVIPNGGTFNFGVTLGTNNSATTAYRLRVTGYDQDGEFRSWFWRGSDNNQEGGGRFLREASKISVTKASDFDADVSYGTISGKVEVAESGTDLEGAKVTVAAPPSSYGDSADNRELDIVNCANVFGETVADGAGNYEANFLPYAPGDSDKRYMVLAKPKFSSSTLTPLWNDEFGSCYDAMDYDARSTANLISLHSDGSETRDFDLAESQNHLRVNGNYSYGTTSADRWVRVREKIPGYKVLASPIVAEGQGDGDGIKNFYDLPPGEYFVEIGRRTVSVGVVSSSLWYTSRYSNNIAYFKGEERAAERWKTVSGKWPETSKSYAMGYVAKSPGSGRKGWMYRTHLRAVGAGYIATESFSGMVGFKEVVRVVPKGATVRGHVSRSGGRTNKEMMVRLSSSDGTKVLRTALTDGGGNFLITGLATGKYSISVNSDSWRGIGRSFSGKHTIYVTAGKSYSAGTLRFRDGVDRTDVD